MKHLYVVCKGHVYLLYMYITTHLSLCLLVNTFKMGLMLFATTGLLIPKLLNFYTNPDLDFALIVKIMKRVTL